MSNRNGTVINQFFFTWGMLGYFLSFSTNDIYYYF